MTNEEQKTEADKLVGWARPKLPGGENNKPDVKAESTEKYSDIPKDHVGNIVGKDHASEVIQCDDDAIKFNMSKVTKLDIHEDKVVITEEGQDKNKDDQVDKESGIVKTEDSMISGQDKEEKESNESLG